MRATPVAILWLALTLVGAGTSSTAASTDDDAQRATLPDTPQGRIAAEFLRVFNAGDESAIDGFVNRHWGAGDLLGVGHSGGAPGISASFRIYPRAGYTVCVLSNEDPAAADRVAFRIEELIGRLE